MWLVRLAYWLVRQSHRALPHKWECVGSHSQYGDDVIHRSETFRCHCGVRRSEEWQELRRQLTEK